MSNVSLMVLTSFDTNVLRARNREKTIGRWKSIEKVGTFCVMYVCKFRRLSREEKVGAGKTFGAISRNIFLA